jgi:two-component system response regulator AtoC
MVHQLIGLSPALRALEEELSCVARSEAKVLITGESGVGKEIVARRIHESSRRAANSLVTINCAGVPDTLLESELFGHLRGSFTDAHRDKKGWLEQAHRGTILLDEIGEMSLRMQALLLRFLETGEIQRIGSERHHTIVDVRVISSTNRDLLERVKSNEFRDDLYYRLNVVHLQIPPLRERLEDVPALLAHFFRVCSLAYRVPAPELSPEALACLSRYEWPGNVRELRNLVERMTVRASGRIIQAADLPAEVLAKRVPPATPGPSLLPVQVADVLFERLVVGRESFWTVVQEPLMSRDLTREDVRGVVRLGLERTGGSYKALVDLFNMQADDYKRLLNFLKKYQCRMPFQQFRSSPVMRTPSTSSRSSWEELRSSR